MTVDPERINPWRCRWCGKPHVVTSLTEDHEKRCELNPHL